MNRSYGKGLAAAVFCLASTAATAAGNVEAGKQKAYTCVGCHGNPVTSNAYPAYRAPLIGGQSADYIVAALKAYRDEQRWHPTMQAQAKSMSDEDMADLAAYFASLAK